MNPKSLLTMQDLSKAEILELLNDAKAFSHSHKDWQVPDFIQGLTANLFFEPSTRTHYSFLSAELGIGLKPVDFHAASSSLSKGESLYDTVRTFEAIGYQLLIIRDKEDEYFKHGGHPVYECGWNAAF